MDTESHTGRTPSEDEGRDLSDVSIKPGTPKIVCKLPGAGRLWPETHSP